MNKVFFIVNNVKKRYTQTYLEPHAFLKLVKSEYFKEYFRKYDN